MTTGDIRDILMRIPIPPGQLALYKALYCTNQALTKLTLALIMREGDEERADKVMMALAKRIKGTPGFEDVPQPAYQVLFEEEIVDGERYFTMRPELRHAIDRIPALKKVMDELSVIEIYQRFDHGESWWLDLSGD